MINYTVKTKKNPINGDIKYYPQIGKQKFVNMEDIAKDIAGMCTVTLPDIVSVLSALQEQIEETMKQGRSVRFGYLGSFRPTITGEACETKEEVTAQKIKQVRVRFTPGSYLRKCMNMKELKFIRED